MGILIVAWWFEGSPERLDMPQLIAAIQKFHREHPERISVHISELIQGHYLNAGSLPSFLEKDGSVALNIASDRAQEPLAWCREPDGTYLVVMVDGSAHQISPTQIRSMPAFSKILE